MKTRFFVAFLSLGVSLCAFGAAKVKVDSIRQDAPWSANVDIVFTVSGIGGIGAVDVKAEAFAGENILGELSLNGDFLGLAKDGTYSVSFDPGAIELEGRFFVEDFSVKLTLVPSHPSWNVPLYRVYDLTKEDEPVELITPADILTGEYGTYHWSCEEPAIAPGQAVPYTNLVWTGVTQAQYKTSKLVMRYMPAKGDLVRICCMNDSRYTMEDNFYVAVYETTHKQWFNVMGEKPPCTASYVDARPVETITYAQVRGHSPENYWPRPPAQESFIGRLRAKTSDTPFDLPAAYRLTYAAQAGTRFGYAGSTVSLPTSTWPDNTPIVSVVDGVTVTNVPSGRLDTAPAGVGQFNPTVSGLYDIIGNVKEMCVDWGFNTQSAQRSLGPKANVDIENPTLAISSDNDLTKRYYTGSAYTHTKNYKFWQVTLNYQRGKVNPEVGVKDIGVRLVLDAYGNEENVKTILSDVAPAFSAAVPIYLQPYKTSFFRTATNSIFSVSWVFPKGATKVDLTVSGMKTQMRYSDLDVTEKTLVLPEAADASEEDVYDIVLEFDDGTVKSCQMAVVRGAQEGSEATIDYVSPRSPAWHWMRTAAVFPIMPNSTNLVVDGVTNRLDGAFMWYGYSYPQGAEKSEVSLFAEDGEYANELHPRRGMVIKFQ